MQNLSCKIATEPFSHLIELDVLLSELFLHFIELDEFHSKPGYHVIERSAHSTICGEAATGTNMNLLTTLSRWCPVSVKTAKEELIFVISKRKSLFSASIQEVRPQPGHCAPP
jgi:hypothetical protein